MNSESFKRAARCNDKSVNEVLVAHGTDFHIGCHLASGTSMLEDGIDTNLSKSYRKDLLDYAADRLASRRAPFVMYYRQIGRSWKKSKAFKCVADAVEFYETLTKEERYESTLWAEDRDFPISLPQLLLNRNRALAQQSAGDTLIR